MTRLLFVAPLKNTCRLILYAAIIVTLLVVGAVKPAGPARAMTTTVVQSVEATASTPTPTDNDYTRINNAVVGASPGDVIQLDGNFDWRETNAAASWALGSDGIAANSDDYSILVPPGLNNVTLTAAGLGSAEIRGPGDLPTVNLEGVLVFDGGDNQNWTISNLRFVDFDLSIAMFNGAGGIDAFNGTVIDNNYILVATDVNATVAPADTNQNIGIHFSFGTNQRISNNSIDFRGDGLADTPGGHTAASVGMQSNTSGGNVYDGLLIENNTLRVLNAQSLDPETILGIWENAHGHTSNITVRGNQFLNLDDSNDPSSNLQRAFRITSHSSPSTTVAYSNNSVFGANIGFQWITGSNFAGNQPVQLTSNTLTGVNTGFFVQSNGLGHFSDNTVTGLGSGTGVNVTSGSIATVDAVTASNRITGLSNGVNVAGTATISGNLINGNDTGIAVQSGGVANVHFNRIVGNLTAGLADSGGSTNAENNWWGCNAGPGGSGCDAVTGSADFDPWLVLTVTATPGSVQVGGTSAIAAKLTINSSAADTSASGHIPDGTPVAFSSVNGSIFPFSATTIAGQAAATFTAACPTGAGSASATVDSQTAAATVTVVDTTPPTVTCPANITVNAPAGQCSAAVSFSPTGSDACPGVTFTSVPPSGSSFPLGPTTVNVTAHDGAGNTATCSFTVTVKDVTPPAITCPADIRQTSLGGACVVVNYVAPAATEACSAAPVTCTPPSGSCFPVGTTTVTCSATDASANTGTCTFKVSIFDYCLEDDATGNRLRVSSISGAWEFEICSKGQFFSGSGQAQTSSCKIEIRPPSSGKPPDKTVTATINKCTNSATATIVIAGTTYRFTDSNISNSRCLCH